MRQIKIGQSITNHESASLDKYLQEIGRIDMLTTEEEVALARRIKQGDQTALTELVEANLRFVVSVSKQYQNQGLSLPDLINEGNLGLIKAAQRFDETRGFKFISYAVWWIRQSILHALAELSRTVRLPLNKISFINKINQTCARLEQEYEREPSADEIAAALELSPKDIKEALRNTGRDVSMDAPMFTSSEGESTMYEILSDTNTSNPEAGLITESLRQDVQRALSTLPEREAAVLRLYFGLNNETPLTLTEIGERLGLTSERVRQIKSRALFRLKHSSRKSLLKPHLI
ncbi:MAG: RNA polymerase sigma factor RpoD/SigA [Candidatus Pacebacteria bacterium]|nr:RNA polymerase sigma factor RpoD/SigA [Candidatus Paceibacterota bacterium]